MATLWLVRHGETDWNKQGRFQGSSDEPLNELGCTQAQSLAPRLAKMQFDAIYASDLIRVRQTAKWALGGDDRRVVPDSRLREWHFGAWEGLTIEQIKADNAQVYDLWDINRGTNPHGGENVDDLIRRVSDFHQEVFPDTRRSEHILVFAHGAVFGVWMALLFGSDPSKWWQYRFLNCTLTEIFVLPRGSILSRFNDMSHLPE